MLLLLLLHGGGADLFNVIVDHPVIHSSFPYLDNFTSLLRHVK